MDGKPHDLTHTFYDMKLLWFLILSNILNLRNYTEANLLRS